MFRLEVFPRVSAVVCDRSGHLSEEIASHAEQIEHPFFKLSFWEAELGAGIIHTLVNLLFYGRLDLARKNKHSPISADDFQNGAIKTD